MEERILISSELYNIKKIASLTRKIWILGTVVSAVVLVLFTYLELASMWQKPEHYGVWHSFDNLWSLFSFYLSRGWFAESGIIVAVCLFGGLSIVAIFGIVLHALACNIELKVSDKRVYGHAAFGKSVDLPLDSISAVGSSWLKGISVATSSGRINFLLVKNRDEIHKCISNLLMERQNKQILSTTIKHEMPQSNADELRKFKELLDDGIITQEEFDAKKKQLLGL